MMFVQRDISEALNLLTRDLAGDMPHGFPAIYLLHGGGGGGWGVKNVYELLNIKTLNISTACAYDMFTDMVVILFVMILRGSSWMKMIQFWLKISVLFCRVIEYHLPMIYKTVNHCVGHNPTIHYLNFSSVQISWTHCCARLRTLKKCWTDLEFSFVLS